MRHKLSLFDDPVTTPDDHLVIRPLARASTDLASEADAQKDPLGAHFATATATVPRPVYLSLYSGMVARKPLADGYYYKQHGPFCYISLVTRISRSRATVQYDAVMIQTRSLRMTHDKTEPNCMSMYGMDVRPLHRVLGRFSINVNAK